MTAKEYFRKEWGTGFVKATLSEKNGLLEMSMEDIYQTMQRFADLKSGENKFTEEDMDKAYDKGFFDGQIGNGLGSISL